MLIKNFLTELYRDGRGTTAVEFGVICGAIVLAIMTALSGVASENDKMWTSVAEKVDTAIKSSRP